MDHNTYCSSSQAWEQNTLEQQVPKQTLLTEIYFPNACSFSYGVFFEGGREAYICQMASCPQLEYEWDFPEWTLTWKGFFCFIQDPQKRIIQ